MALPILPLFTGVVGKIVSDRIALPISMRNSSSTIRKFMKVSEALGSASPNSFVPIEDWNAYNGKIYAYDAGDGYDTIGWGHVCLPGEPRVIDLKRAWELLEKDSDIKSGLLKKRLPKLNCTQGQFDVLFSLSFNAGWSSNSNFHRCLLANDMEGARQNLDFWKVGNNVWNGLVKRRMCEHIIWLGGEPNVSHYSQISESDANAFKESKSKEILKKYTKSKLL